MGKLTDAIRKYWPKPLFEITPNQIPQSLNPQPITNVVIEQLQKATQAQTAAFLSEALEVGGPDHLARCVELVVKAQSQPEPAPQAMWVVFSTVDMDNDQATYEDFFSMVETEAQAIKAYNVSISDPKTYAAGYAQIAGGTEPQWMDGGEA